MSRTRRIITASLAVAAAVGLAACDAEQIGAAVVIDGDRLSVSDLQERVEEVQALEGFDVQTAGGMPSFQRELLTRHIQHEIFVRLAENEGIEISEADIDDAIEGFESQAPEGELAPLLAQNGYTMEAFRDGVTDQLIAEAFAAENQADNAAISQALIDVGDELGIEVNPRYGVWGQDLIVSADTGSISVVAPDSGDGAEIPPAGEPPAGEPPAGEPPAEAPAPDSGQ